MREETISTKTIYDGKVIHVVQKEVKTAEDKTAIREIVLHRGAVCAVAVTKEDKIVLVKQFRKAAEDDLIEIPAGKLEIDEVAETAIMRELKEETGYEVTNLKYITKFYTSPGFSNEIGYLYFAELGNQSDTCFDEDEDIEIFEYDLEEVLHMIRTGQIIDAKTIVGILMYAQSNK